MASFAQKLKVTCGGHGFLWKDTHPFTRARARARATASASWTSPPIMAAARFFSSSPVAAAGVVASHLHTSTPWMTLTPEIDPATGRKVDRFYSMTDKQILKLERKKSLKVPEEAWCFGSSRGWLSFIDRNDCSLYLSNPFHDSPLVRLPSIETLPSVLGVKRNPSSNNSIDRFIMADQWSEQREKPREFSTHHYHKDPDSLSKSIVKHLALSCEPFNYEDDCVAMVIHGEHSQLAYCRVGREDSWTTLIGGLISSKQTVCALKSGGGGDMKLFYSMYSDKIGSGIDVWEIPKPWGIPARHATFMYQLRGTKLHEEFEFETSECNLRNRCTVTKKYLVLDESSGDIMLIIRHRANHVAEDGSIVAKDPAYDQLIYKPYSPCCIKFDPYQLNPQPIPYKTLRFDVYKVDMKNQRLERINFLDDRVLFLGLNQSFTLSACEFPCLKSNSIYFTDDLTPMIWNESFPYGGHDFGIYNLENNNIESCYPFPHDLEKDKKIRPSPLWVAPNCYV